MNPQSPPRTDRRNHGAHRHALAPASACSLRSKLTWNRLYRATSYLESALWTIPFLAILVVLLLAPLLRVLDAWLGWRLSGLGVAGAQALYQTIITLTLSFLVFTFGSLLVAIQIAGGQLTPRIIATTLLRDNVVRDSVGLFVFTLVFAVMALNRLERTVHEIVALVTAMLGIACMATFLFLIDYAARLLRPVSILARVGDEGARRDQGGLPRRPERCAEARDGARGARVGRGASSRTTGSSDIVLAVDLDAGGARRDGPAASSSSCRRSATSWRPTSRCSRSMAAPCRSTTDRLHSAVAFGPERTLEQDPLFAFRILADIALKALSPAINDPTTGVLALDQLHRLLRTGRPAALARRSDRRRSGQPRVIFRTPNWEDFVAVSCNEIRACGAGNVQIARRLRAMLDNLLHRCRSIAMRRSRRNSSGSTRRSNALYPPETGRSPAFRSQGLGGSARGSLRIDRSHARPRRAAACGGRSP